jgi:hypothetical protein
MAPAWLLLDPAPNASTPPRAANRRPPCDIQAYDTTAAATSAEHVRRVARRLHVGTLAARGVVGRASPDRVDM